MANSSTSTNADVTINLILCAAKWTVNRMLTCNSQHCHSFLWCVAMLQHYPHKLLKHYTLACMFHCRDGWCLCNFPQVPQAAVLEAGVTTSEPLSPFQAHCIDMHPLWVIPLQPSPVPCTFDITLYMQKYFFYLHADDSVLSVLIAHSFPLKITA